MKDSILLLAIGFFCAGLAWAFFFYFQSQAFAILFLILMVTFLLKPIKRMLKQRSK